MGRRGCASSELAIVAMKMAVIPKRRIGIVSPFMLRPYALGPGKTSVCRKGFVRNVKPPWPRGVGRDPDARLAPMRRSTVGLLLIVTTMVAALAILAIMQYRWLGELSEAEQQRLRAALSLSTHEMAQEVDHEINRIPANFQNAVADPDELARHAREWRSNARDARLVRTFYLAQPDDANGGNFRLARLDVVGGKLVPIEWPAELAALRTLLSTPETEQARRPPVITSIPASLIPLRAVGPPEP